MRVYGVCALYPFRLGKNPFRSVTTRELTDEQKVELREKFRKNVLEKWGQQAVLA